TLDGDDFKNKEKVSGDHLPFSESNTVESVKEIKHPGPYRITVNLAVKGSEEATIHAATMVLKVDGKELERRDLGWDNRKSITLTAEAPLNAGNHGLALE